MDERIDSQEPSLWSKKFIAYMATMPLLIGFLCFQVACEVYLTVKGHEPLFSEEFLLIQVYVIAILAVCYVGGQAALDALLGWIRGGGSKPPQTIVNVQQEKTKYDEIVGDDPPAISPRGR